MVKLNKIRLLLHICRNNQKSFKMHTKMMPVSLNNVQYWTKFTDFFKTLPRLVELAIIL